MASVIVGSSHSVLLSLQEKLRRAKQRKAVQRKSLTMGTAPVCPPLEPQLAVRSAGEPPIPTPSAIMKWPCQDQVIGQQVKFRDCEQLGESPGGFVNWRKYASGVCVFRKKDDSPSQRKRILTEYRESLLLGRAIAITATRPRRSGT
jgi:hypothetical protein